MEQPPHPMRLGDDEGDYYRGTYKTRPPSRPSPRPTMEEAAVIAF